MSLYALGWRQAGEDGSKVPFHGHWLSRAGESIQMTNRGDSHAGLGRGCHFVLTLRNRGRKLLVAVWRRTKADSIPGVSGTTHLWSWYQPAALPFIPATVTMQQTTGKLSDLNNNHCFIASHTVWVPNSGEVQLRGSVLGIFHTVVVRWWPELEIMDLGKVGLAVHLLLSFLACPYAFLGAFLWGTEAW
jgi:hypothetical protein